MPTPLEIDEARGRWRELAGEDAGLGPIAAFHDQRLAQLAEQGDLDVRVELDPDTAAAAIRQGTPLLQAGRLVVDTESVLAELRRVARNLAETAELGSPGQRTAEALASADLDMAALLAPSLSSDRAAIEREAERAELHADTLEELLGLALQPFLWEARSQLAALTDVDRWDRGFCPVCGAWPGLAELVGPEKRRVLRCVRCAASWSWFVLLCPYCGNDDHRTLGVLQEDKATERVDLCRRCQGYVKAIVSYAGTPGPRLLAEDVATLDLDLVARERGFKRPGEVDVDTAGIPRIVREGRSAPGIDSD